jgi:protein-S-isoprenylcysteine O-methyltransferase Ste14
LSMISLVMVLVAASLGMMCVFDDIPTHIDFEDWSIVWTGQTGASCLSRNPHYLLVIVVFSLFFTFVGLLSWAVVCDITGLKADEGKVEVGLEIQPGLDASSPSDDDGYVPILCWQLVALPLVVALYFEMTGQSASQISQSVTQSSSVPTSIVALGCGVFMLIIADRVVYITESRTWKLLMQWLSLMAFCAYWITADSLAVDESDSSENWSWTGSWSIRLMVACSMYFYKSATQLERKLKRKHGRAFTQYDQVPGDKITMLHKLRFLIRRTPFLMELVYLVRDSHFCA